MGGRGKGGRPGLIGLWACVVDWGFFRSGFFFDFFDFFLFQRWCWMPSCSRWDQAAFRRPCAMSEFKALSALDRSFTCLGGMSCCQAVSTSEGLFLFPVENCCREVSNFQFFWEWGWGDFNEKKSSSCFVWCQSLVLITPPFRKRWLISP